MGRYMGTLSASALVNGDVHEHRAVLHLRQIFSLEQLRGRAAGNQHGSDDQVRILQHPFHVAVVGDQRLDMRAEHVVQLFQAFQADIQNGDIGAHAYGDLAGIHPHRAAAQDHHVGLRCSRYARQQDALPAEALFQIFRAFLDGQPARDLAHRRQAGQAPVLLLNRLIGHRLHLSGQQRVRLFPVGRQVQIGIQDHAVMEEAILFRQRLLDLHHHVNQRPDIRRVVQQGRPCFYVFGVLEPGSQPCAGLHVYMVSRGNIGAYIVRCQSDPVFIVFDFLYASDFHTVLSVFRLVGFTRIHGPAWRPPPSGSRRCWRPRHSCPLRRIPPPRCRWRQRYSP